MKHAILAEFLLKKKKKERKRKTCFNICSVFPEAMRMNENLVSQCITNDLL